MRTLNYIGMGLFVAILVAMAFLHGCVSLPEYYWPEAEASNRIAWEHDNCTVSHMVFQEHLASVGIESYVICQRIPVDLEQTHLQKELQIPADRVIKGHCALEARNPTDGKLYLIDIHAGIGGFETKLYKEWNGARRYDINGKKMN